MIHYVPLIIYKLRCIQGHRDHRTARRIPDAELMRSIKLNKMEYYLLRELSLSENESSTCVPRMANEQETSEVIV